MEHESPSFSIRKDPEKPLLELVVDSPRGEKWEYGIPFNHRGDFDFEDIHAIRLEFGEDFGEELMTAIEDAVDQALSD